MLCVLVCRFGRLWRVGDVVGCYLDIDAGTVAYSLNGSLESPNGVAFKGLDTVSLRKGVSPAISLCDGFSCEVNVGPADGGGASTARAFACVPHWVALVHSQSTLSPHVRVLVSGIHNLRKDGNQ